MLIIPSGSGVAYVGLPINDETWTYAHGSFYSWNSKVWMPLKCYVQHDLFPRCTCCNLQGLSHLGILDMSTTIGVCGNCGCVFAGKPLKNEDIQEIFINALKIPQDALGIEGTTARFMLESPYEYP